jgi:DNA polymerase-1
MPKTLLLIDASNHAYRAYHAIQSDMRAPDGFPTRALFGFTRMLLNLLRDQKPDYVALVFDRGVSFRNALYPDYKGQRPDMPEDLKRQWPELVPLAEATGYTVFNEPDTEADDIIGTLAVKFASPEVQVKIVSGDKDFCQLVNDRIFILDLLKGQELGPREVEERWGVPAERIIDLLSLMGDASDNVPGVPGVGEKKAAQFLQKYGTLEGVLANAAAIGGKTGQAVAESKDKVDLARQLITIKTDMPVTVTLDQLVPRPIDKPAMAARLTRYNFRGLLKELGLDGVAATRQLAAVAGEAQVELLSSTPASYSVKPCPTIWGTKPLKELSEQIKKSRVAIAVHGQMDALELAWEYDGLPRCGIVPMDDRGREIVLPALYASKGIVAYDSKQFLKTSLPGIKIAGDILLADYVLHPDQRHEQDDICKRILELPVSRARGEQAQAIFWIDQVQQARLHEQHTDSILERFELPLIPILAEMEQLGIGLDTYELGLLGREVEQKINTYTQEIYRLAGKQFNINSTQQLAVILYDEMGLLPSKKTKSGRSTDAETLEKIDIPLTQQILEYREYAKLKSTYIDALPKTLGSDGRVHTNFEQAVAATGRLSSKEPNLQNIPIRTEEGRKIRHCFIARSGHVFVSADYSQIELRILAHLCGEGPLLEAFNKGEDIHRRTAAEVFGISQTEVSPEQRRAAKAINFGILYGMGPTRLADELKISKAQAQSYIEGYFARQPQVRSCLDKMIQQARDHGYSLTMFGRRRPVAGITASNPMDRAAAERIAINTPVQGTAADLIKLAMIRAKAALAGLSSKLILQVHDELLFETPLEEVSTLSSRIREAMEGVASLKLPLKVDIHSGPTWDTAH